MADFSECDAKSGRFLLMRVELDILQRHLPTDMRGPTGLPGIAPEKGAWLRVDEAYGPQMQRRAEVLASHGADVLYGDGTDAAWELLEAALEEGAALGFQREGEIVTRPDGVEIAIGAPLQTLGHLFQNDFVLMEKQGEEHVLTGAVLCFPASWRLAEKAERPLIAIHDPVDVYDPTVAKRVQRLFDGVQVGRPLRRYNRLWYADAELHQPRSRTAPREVPDGPGDAQYMRSERQTIIRLPQTRACVFAIHTYVLSRQDALTQLEGVSDLGDQVAATS